MCETQLWYVEQMSEYDWEYHPMRDNIFFSSYAEAKAHAQELNDKEFIEQLQWIANQNREEQEEYQRLRTDHESLVEAGLRQGPFKGEKPTPQIAQYFESYCASIKPANVKRIIEY